MPPADLGIETAEQTKGNLLRAFYAFVSAQCAKGLTTVLVIDEAHQAPAHVLEEIRMLTNVETNEEKLVQVLLVGQPELDDKLDSFELRQLKQRIAVRCQLEPLGEEELGSISSSGSESRERIQASEKYSLRKRSNTFIGIHGNPKNREFPLRSVPGRCMCPTRPRCTNWNY